ncbi:MAG: hypothetical protein ACYC4L_10010 [Chloroflexota bacterium]
MDVRGCWLKLAPALLLSLLLTTLAWQGVGASVQQAPAAPTFADGKAGEPFFRQDAAGREVISWRDNSDNESGFVVEVAFAPGGERHLFRAPANATSFTFPEGFTFGFRTPQECLPRATVTVAVRAINTAGESAPATRTVERECADLPSGLPRSGNPGPALPLAMVGGTMVAAGLALRGRRWRK